VADDGEIRKPIVGRAAEKAASEFHWQGDQRDPELSADNRLLADGCRCGIAGSLKIPSGRRYRRGGTRVKE
jgi:hypothetical protein